jgi:hypothetical protein
MAIRGIALSLRDFTIGVGDGKAWRQILPSVAQICCSADPTQRRGHPGGRLQFSLTYPPNKVLEMTKRAARTKSKDFATEVGKALRRAAREAHRIARIYGTPIYIWEDGKVVAKEPWL